MSAGGKARQKDRRIESRRWNLIATGIELRTSGADNRTPGAETPVRRMFRRRESVRLNAEEREAGSSRIETPEPGRDAFHRVPTGSVRFRGSPNAITGAHWNHEQVLLCDDV